MLLRGLRAARYNARMPSPIAAALLEWYAENARDLPWRRTREPYAIWVSEVMLQQTRVETVLPYYERWMARFPTVQSLAEADLNEVLRLWEGLGYYRRAHNLHSAAQRVMLEHSGELPSSVEELRRLPGVGAYTAAAIAAIAFNADSIALDGNLRRVLARLFDLSIDARSPEGERRLRTSAHAILPPGQAAGFNQALMDLGSLICTPRSPACDVCPLASMCLAYARGTQEQRPVRRAREKAPLRLRVSGVVRKGGRVLIGRRPAGGLLGGLWEFPGGECDDGEPERAALERRIREGLGAYIVPGPEMGRFEHAYTHFRVSARAFECELASGEPEAREHTELRWVRPAELEDYPMGKIDREIARRLQDPSPEGPGARRGGTETRAGA